MTYQAQVPVKEVRKSPQNLSHHFSKATWKRAPNVLKEYYRFLRTPGIGNFAGGLPFVGNFPLDHLSATVVRAKCLSSDGDHLLSPENTALHFQIPRHSKIQDSVCRIDLDSALQYGGAQGYPALYAWLRKLVSDIHHPYLPYDGGFDVMINGGSADGLWKIYELLFNPWDQDLNNLRDREGLLVEEYVYAPPIAQAKPKDINIVPVKMDHQGMLAYGPNSLFDTLSHWDYNMGKRPHAVYLIPTGQNPTSGVLSFSRRKDLYEVCCKFDVIIIEDDPYWNLYYPSSKKRTGLHREGKDDQDYPPNEHHNYRTESLGLESSGFDFLDELIPSMLSIDRDGRVIRLDSFSKTMAPGCRLGWITAQPSVCEQLFRITDGTTQQPSGITQAIIVQILGEFSSHSDHAISTNGNDEGDLTIWGVKGWVNWLEGLRSAYERRMLKMSRILEENKFTANEVEMFTFAWPMGGMFIWVCVNISSHPLAVSVSHRRLMQALWILCTQPPYQILTVPGGDFAATNTIKTSTGYKYLRFCFAAVDDSLLEPRTRSFGAACRAYWSLQSTQDIDRILHEEDAQAVNGQTIEEAEKLDREPMKLW